MAIAMVTIGSQQEVKDILRLILFNLYLPILYYPYSHLIIDYTAMQS